MNLRWHDIIQKIDDYRWQISPNYKSGMKVPGLVYATEKMLELIQEDESLEQVANVAFLPGIVNYSLAMPDIHCGYGFPIGGVCATEIKEGVVSPGGVGFDINCGVRLLRSDLNIKEVRPKINDLLQALFINIPSGLGTRGRIKINAREMDDVLVKGAVWAVERGFGNTTDLEVIEDGGYLENADPARVSDKARQRGMPQLGTLGAGNHFLEIGYVQEIYEPDVANVLGIGEIGQVVIWIHTGSRGLGHQICTDYLKVMGRATEKYQIKLSDRQLACAPVKSEEGQNYLTAMSCAANYAWANRQFITHWIRHVFADIFSRSCVVNLETVYDIAHNIAKIEEHVIRGEKASLCVHRKGATRAFPAGHPDVPQVYRRVGQPVLIPGDMGRYSYVMVGTDRAMRETFGSSCHGAGRVQSRSAARRSLKGPDIINELEKRGITVKSDSISSLAEEASPAYKDVTSVVEVMQEAGLARKIAKIYPVGVIKG